MILTKLDWRRNRQSKIYSAKHIQEEKKEQMKAYVFYPSNNFSEHFKKLKRKLGHKSAKSDKKQTGGYWWSKIELIV